MGAYEPDPYVLQYHDGADPVVDLYQEKEIKQDGAFRFSGTDRTGTCSRISHPVSGNRGHGGRDESC